MSGVERVAPPLDTRARQWLESVAGEVLQHGLAGTFRVAEAPSRQPASVYTDPRHFESERHRLFRRLPLMLAASCEIPRSGDFRTYDVAGVPVLLTRDPHGTARAMVNICTHRGSPVAASCGNTPRLVCPYHGWTFALDGRLVAVAAAADFGDIRREDYGLRPLPLLERGGLIWVIADPDSQLDIEAFLGAFGEALCQFDLAGWTLISEKHLPGANWKLAFDAHLEFYHLPVLHRNTFGPQTDSRALYFFEGPHERLIRPIRAPKNGMPAPADLFSWHEKDPAAWPLEALMLGEWILFPNVSFNSFYDGGRGLLISRIFPGAIVDTSVTVQSYYLAGSPDDVSRQQAQSMADFLERVVAEEDLANSVRQQRALSSGLLREVTFGRNESGITHFHQWVSRILATADEDLNRLFREARDLA